MQNEHDVNVYTLHPIDNGIRHASLVEVHPSNISWHLLMYYSPRYLILKFTLKRIMVNVLLHRCCKARIFEKTLLTSQSLLLLLKIDASNLSTVRWRRGGHDCK